MEEANDRKFMLITKHQADYRWSGVQKESEREVLEREEKALKHVAF